MIEFKNMTDTFNNIQVPKEIDLVIEAAIKRGKKHRIKGYWKPSLIAAAFMITLAISVNISPAFANILSRIPGLSGFTELVKFDKSIVAAIDNDLSKEINKFAEDKGIKFTIIRAILDKRSLIIEYSIEAAGDYKQLKPALISVKNSYGSYLSQGGYSTDDGKFRDTNKTTGVHVAYLKDGIDSLPDDIIIELKTFRNYTNYPFESHNVDGNWNISFSTKDVLVNTKPLTYKAKRDTIIDHMKFKIHSINVYPTITDVKIKFDTDNAYEFTRFKNPRLEDEQGNVYEFMRSNFVSDNEYLYQFQSSFFYKARRLYFKADGINYIPKESKYIKVDLDNKKVTADDYYYIEYSSHTLDSYINTEKHTKDYCKTTYNLKLTFVIKDKDIINEVRKDRIISYGIIFGTIIDDTNNKIDISNYERSFNDDGSINLTISMKELKHAPHTLILNISNASKGILKPISVELKR